MKVLKSTQDKSVNFVLDTDDDGAIESRYVQRSDDYFIIYLSSQTGCDQACRFCHLTQTGQTMMRDVTPQEYMEQIDRVLPSRQAGIKRVHINFMARGEPLLNEHVNDGLIEDMELKFLNLGLDPVFKISTIFPKSQDIYHRLRHPKAQIYYSLYSTQVSFRRRWIPRAEDPNIVCDKLHMWQMVTGSRVVLHYALIQGMNDSVDDANRIIELARRHRLECNFNLVRYNPPNDKSKEASEEQIALYMAAMRQGLGEDRCKIVPRVGYDVFASCGCFFAGDNQDAATVMLF